MRSLIRSSEWSFVRPDSRSLYWFGVRVAILALAASIFLAPDLQTPTASGSTGGSAMPAAKESQVLAYTAPPAPGGEENRFTLRLRGADLELSDTRSGSILLSAPQDSLRGVEIEGADGDTNDTLTVDFSGGLFSLPDGIRFDGGVGGYDTLVLTGGTFALEVHEPKNQNDGVITLDGMRIVYSNIEPVTDTGFASTLYIICTHWDDLINIVDGGTSGGYALTQVNSSNNPPTFESYSFANKTYVSIYASWGSDTITLNNPNPAAGLSLLNIFGDGGNDTIIVTATPMLSVGVVILGSDGSDTFNITPTPGAALSILGNDPIPPALPGDLLVVDLTGTTNPALTVSSESDGYRGTFTFDNRGTVTFWGIESLPQQAAATHFSVSAPPSATAGTAFNFTMTALNAFNNTATAYTGMVHFTSSDGAAVLPADTTLTNGVGTFSATLQTAGGRTITATDTATSSITGTSGNIAVSAAAATHFSVSALPSATAGTAFNFTVTALDPFDNTATGYTGTVHFTSSDGAAVLPADTTLTNGVGTFPATLQTAGGRTITATDTATPSITGTSSNIAVSAAAATHFFVSAPPSATAGTAFNFTVTALDPFDNTATGYPGTVHFTSSDGAAVLPANATLTNGVGTFSSTLKTAWSRTITATDTVNASITGTSSNIAVSAGAATHFSLSAPPSATAGTAFNFTVTALDPFDNTATGYPGTVHFTSSDGAAVLPANSTLTNGAGTFPATLKTAGSRTIRATDTATPSVIGTSNNIAVSAAAATHFSVSAPVSATSGTAFNFTVTALDPFNNTATGYPGTVHFTSSDGAAVLPANSTLTNGAGTFPATLNTAGGRTITATDTVNGSITGTSSNIAVSAAAATHFSVSAPASATAGTAFNFTVTALDPFDNTATGYAGTVHCTCTDRAAVLPADSTLTNGVGTFSATLKTAGGQTITASDTVNESIAGTSNNINDTPVIPAMTGWGMILMSALLVGSMICLLRRRRLG
jgi:hypothetical protein